MCNWMFQSERLTSRVKFNLLMDAILYCERNCLASVSGAGMAPEVPWPSTSERSDHVLPTHTSVSSFILIVFAASCAVPPEDVGIDRRAVAGRMPNNAPI